MLLLVWPAATTVGCRPAPLHPRAADGIPSARSGAPAALVVDPPSQVPLAVTVGDPDERVLSLTPPVSDRAAMEVVRAFFRAITDENLEVLATLMTPDATVPSGARSPSSALLEHWRGRMNHLRYQTLAHEALYDEGLIEAYRFHDWDVALPGRPPRPADMHPSDVLVRVPMQLVRSGNERVFGDEILLMLRRQKDSLAIAEQIEDFPLP